MSASPYNFFRRRRMPMQGVVRLETPEAKGLAEFAAQRTAAAEFNPVGPLWMARPTRANTTNVLIACLTHVGEQT